MKEDKDTKKIMSLLDGFEDIADDFAFHRERLHEKAYALTADLLKQPLDFLKKLAAHHDKYG